MVNLKRYFGVVWIILLLGLNVLVTEVLNFFLLKAHRADLSMAL
jgi:hypothetical protein